MRDLIVCGKAAVDRFAERLKQASSHAEHERIRAR